MDAAKPLNAMVWTRDPDDWYVEPEWVSERLFAVEKFEGRIWDPACGLGRVVAAARAAGYEARGSDKVIRSDHCVTPMDFLEQVIILGENIVSNPPFGIARPFIERALHLSRAKVAMLLPTVWANSASTGTWLESTPLYREYRIGPRPSMPPGRVIVAGEKPGRGKADFSWFVWLKGYEGRPSVHWLRKLEVVQCSVRS
jgi:hypothetical protein